MWILDTSCTMNHATLSLASVLKAFLPQGRALPRCAETEVYPIRNKKLYCEINTCLVWFVFFSPYNHHRLWKLLFWFTHHRLETGSPQRACSRWMNHLGLSVLTMESGIIFFEVSFANILTLLADGFQHEFTIHRCVAGFTSTLLCTCSPQSVICAINLAECPFN